MSKEYRILIEQTNWVETYIEADSLEEAIKEAQDEQDDWSLVWDTINNTGNYEVYDTAGSIIKEGSDW